MSNYVTQNSTSEPVDESDEIEWDDNEGWGDDDDQGWGEDDEETWDEPVTGKTPVDVKVKHEERKVGFNDIC